MVNGAPPKDPAPQIATGTVEILQQVLAQNQELMQLISANKGKSGRKNTNRPPNPSIGYNQGLPHHPMPVYFDECFWIFGRRGHKGGNFN